MKTNIIGIAGTNGSGKDSIGQILVEQFNYIFVSVTESLRTEASRRGMEVARPSLRLISAEWRREYGLGILVEKVVAEYGEQIKIGRKLVMASLRNPAEADSIHSLGGTVVWLDADPRIRYERIQANAPLRNRADEDNKTYEQFLAEEEAEMHSSGDAATLNMSAVKAKADVVIVNNFDDKHALAAEVAKQLHLS